ncbi:MAG: ABC transporter permease subunit [Candidatus Kerfeldbacteria bacterium]
MFAIFWRTLKSRKLSLIIYSMAMVLSNLMFVAMFPTILEQSANWEELTKAYPEGFLQAFGIETLSFKTLESFLGIENFSIIWPLIATIFLVSVAGGAIAYEIERGTIEIMISKPVSRTKIFFGKYLQGMLALVVFVGVSVFSVIPLAMLYDLEYNLDSYLAYGLIGLLFGWAIFSMTMMFSAFFSERSRPYMLTGGLLTGMYILNIILQFKEELDFLKYFTFFHYLDYNVVFLDAKIEWLSIAVFAGVAIATTAAGMYWFNRRDIAITS